MLDLNNTVCVSTSGVSAGIPAQAGRFGYDATEDKGRRKSPSVILRSEDDELNVYRRGQLITLGRDIRRNFSIAAWAIRRHLDYVARFRFRAMTGNRELDQRITSLVDWAALPQNFHSGRRHGLRKYLRLAEAARTVDGDMLNVLLSNGRLQPIEADRIRTPQSFLDAPAPPADVLRRMRYGVVLSADGSDAAESYAINRRGPKTWVGPDLQSAANSFTFERLVPARNAIMLAYWDRFDQVRGVSPVAAALNSYRDIYEGFDLALAQAKVAQLFALAIKRNSLAAINAAAGDDEPTDYTTIDFNRGPVLLDLDPGDEAAFLNSQNPSANWQAFMQMVIAVALKALDIPFSFFDESHTNYSGSRGAWLMYDQSADDKREDLREFLNRWVRWRLGTLIYFGVLQLPAGFDPLKDLRYAWIARKVPWIDPLKEIQAAKLEVDAGFNSTPAVCESMGLDAFEIADHQKAYLDYRTELGLPPPGTMQPIPVTIYEGTEVRS